MDTFELLPSLAHGELSDTSAPELVSAVFRSRASGTLWLETEESNEIRCFFRAGDMCGTGSFNGFQTLAHVLLTNDWVAALDIDSTREEAAAKNQRHGEVLVQRGLLSADQLRTALGAQHTANLTTLLALTQANYDWRGSEPPPPWAREVVVDPVSCVIDAMEQEQHAPRRQKILAWLGNSAVRLSLDWPELQGRVALQPLDRRAAALLALPRSLGEFAQASRLPQTRAEALLVALLLAGGVEPQPRAQQAPQPAPAPRSQPSRPQPVARQEPPPQLEPEHLEPLPPEQLEPLLEPHPEPILEQLHPEPEPEPLLEALPEQEPAPADPFAEPRLGTARPRIELEPDLEPQPELETASGPSRRSAAPPRRASVNEDEALKRLDSLSLDDMAATPQGPPRELGDEPLEIDERPAQRAAAGGQTASVLREEPTFDHALQPAGAGSNEDASRELRKKMLQRGLRNMGGVPQRQEDEGAAPEQAPARPAARVDETRLSPEDLRFLDEVRSRAKMALTQNAYQRLGVPPASTTEQIKAAYLALAKRFHPDRATGELAPVQPELQSLFGALKDSYDRVGTAERRGTYDAEMKAGGSKPSSRKEEASLSLKMGEVLLKKRDFEGAINKLRRAVDLDPTGDALAALAWALVADPKGTPTTKEEAASLINRGLRAPGVTARTYYVAGVLWRTKDPDSAVDAFRKALEMDPQHSDAALELRLIEQRRGKQQKTGGGVLSGLLFGKRKS